ncbi:DUF932 domain-containing protein [Actinomadura madurae]|uniref:DUF932 domain-containing protein n=1 Tax=Actinomadura madurae TaxID=1993 RepID=UPI0020D22B4C|nr:DUF932 domain-containing protein [Actinomadura madurae]MCP9947253.1 DUF932 domain-containing protein [Actinomadura madurae]MCP9964014.1 DUF932 domain-containing protein [Actinomadura madurae]MCP9976490.1 DUF932 domain-containing protein [Actinomadura madurae]MCQ0012016.1 DUF932 domain-containing protein [Actinomadura madurae]MCQ0012684.1 DUF932 domain-containing protein [Actinomadura madurae]
MTIDVNAAFSAEKTAQLAAQRAARDQQIKANADRIAWLEGEVAQGRMVQDGPNRYRVTQGWDAGEVFTVNRNAAGQIAEVVADHGLDTTLSGDAALYTAVPAWHGLGNVIPGGTSDISEVLRLGGIDFGVEKVADQYTWNGGTRVKPDSFITVRDDTGDALGNVGRKYGIIQNRRLFTFLEDLVARHGVIWQSAGPLRGGRKVFVSMRVPDDVIVDPGGLDDPVQLFIVAINSHDGQSPAQAVVTPWRPVCANTERFAVRDAKYRWKIRHTSGALDRLHEARRTLGLTVAYAETFAAEETALARTDLAISEFHKVIADLWDPATEEDSTRARRNDERRRDTLDAMFRAESERAGRTAYAAEKAITDYLDHVAPKRPGRTLTEELGRDRALDVVRATAMVEGTDDDVKSTAHLRLMTLVRR